jgi:hypothetical protein
MEYKFPEEEKLVKYLALLSRILIDARSKAYSCDKQLGELLDAVHNIPDLLCRWPDMKEEWIIMDLEKYESKYLNGNDKYSNIIKHGPNNDWQLIWKDKN